VRFIVWLCKAILVLAVLWLWVVSAAANFAHSLQLAGGSEWALVIAGASAGADVLKAGASFMILAAFRRRMWVAFAAALMIWGATTGWSVRSCVSFISNIMLSAQTTKTKASDKYDDLRQNLAREETYLTTLQGTTVRTRGERVSLSEEIAKQRKVVDEAREKLDKAKPATDRDGVSDLASPYASWVTPELVRAFTVGCFIALLELASNLGPLAFSSLCGERQKKTKADPRSEAAQKPTEETRSQHIEQPKPAVAIATVRPNELKKEPSRPAGVLYTFPKAISDARVPRAKLEAFVLKLTEEHGNGARLPTSEVQRAFGDYMGGAVDPSLLGRWLADFGINRTVRKDRNGVRYYELPKRMVA